MFHPVFLDNRQSVWYMNKAIFKQSILETLESKESVLAQSMPQPSLSEVQLYCHALTFLKKCMQKKLVCTPRNYNSDICEP